MGTRLSGDSKTETLTRVALSLLIIISVISVLASPGSVAAHGSFVTSEFQVSWPDRWQVAIRTDVLVILNDGNTEIYILGAFDETNTPESALAELVDKWFVDDPRFEDPAEISSSAESDETRASIVYTYQIRFDEATVDPYAVQFETRRVSSGLMLWLFVTAPWGVYNADPNVFSSAIDTLAIAPNPTVGETAPTFASSGWRLSVASASRLTGHTALGLSPRAGFEWLVLLMDITNWTSAPSKFSIESALVVSEDDRVQLTASQIESLTMSRAIGLDDQLFSNTALDAGETSRVALAYQIPVETDSLRLQFKDIDFPLVSLMETDLNTSVLPPDAGAPEFQSATIISFSGGSRIQIRTEEGIEHEIQLLGIRIPGPGECFSREALTSLLPLVGSDIILESDPSVLGEEFWYVWLGEFGDNRTLLNHELIQTGAARGSSLPDDARFSVWLEYAADVAAQTGAGMWSTCGS